MTDLKELLKKYNELETLESKLSEEKNKVHKAIYDLIEKNTYVHNSNGYFLLISFNPIIHPNQLTIGIYKKHDQVHERLGEYSIPVSDIEDVAKAMLKIKEVME